MTWDLSLEFPTAILQCGCVRIVELAQKKKHVVSLENVLLSSACGELSEQIHQGGNGLLFSKINHELDNALTL